MHLTFCCCFLISSGLEGGRVGSRMGRIKGVEGWGGWVGEGPGKGD
jgi:hypothetical protein